MPEISPRSCEVHSCVLVDGDEACADGSLDCREPRGHLRPFGEQFDMTLVAEHDMRSHREMRVNATYFWRKYVVPYEPVLLRGLAHAITNESSWTDDAFLARDERGHLKCENDGGRPWYVTVEVNNRVAHNDRWPLLGDWDFCRFVREYRQPKAPTYCIDSIAQEYRGLTRDLGLPHILACDDLYGSMSDLLMWFSKGNTTSSQHFDTEDNIMFQISGTKDIYLSHPNESAAMYMDHHNKFGLSPINVDRVDLQRFPKVAEAKVQYARLEPGDALYLPDSWWHVIKSSGRNIGLALHFHPLRGLSQPWTPRRNELFNHKGLYWAEKQRLVATMREAVARSKWAAVADKKCAHPLTAPPATMHEYNGWPNEMQ